MPKSNSKNTNNLHLIAAFVSGAIVATAGWYFSDRLDISFGQSSGINLVREWNGKNPGKGQCDPGSTPIKMRRIRGCEVVTTTEKCIPMSHHYRTAKTWSGLRVSEVSNPNKRTVTVTNYEQSQSESRRNIKQEMDEYMQQMRDRRGVELSNMKKEYEDMKTQARLNRCQVN